MEFYTRREIAEKTGLSLDTLRYYERVGLVPRVARTSAGRRRFTELDLTWFQLVRCLRDAGMPIAEIQAFTDLMRDGAATVDERLAVLLVHERRIEDQIARLGTHLHQIRAKIAGYAAGETWSAPAEGKPVRAEGGGVRTG